MNIVTFQTFPKYNEKVENSWNQYSCVRPAERDALSRACQAYRLKDSEEGSTLRQRLYLDNQNWIPSRKLHSSGF